MRTKEYSWILFAIISIVVTFFCILSGNFFTKRVSLQIGQVATETIYAPFQVENEDATARKKQEAELAVDTIYKKDSAIQEKAISNIEDLFKEVKIVKDTTIDAELGKTKVEVLSGRSKIGLYNEQYNSLLRATDKVLDETKEICITISSEIFLEGVTAANSDKKLEVRQKLQSYTSTLEMKKIIEDIVNSVLEPNVVIDKAATDEQKKIARDKVDTVYVLAQEKIIEKGTKVTEEVYKLLQKIGYLETDSKSLLIQYFGIGLLILIVAYLYYDYLSKFYIKLNKTMSRKQKNKHLSLIFICYTVAILITRSLINIPFVYLPLNIIGMIVAFATTPYIAFVTHILVVIFSATIFKGDIIFILYFIIAGIASMLIVTRMQERTKTLVSALSVGIIQFLTYIALKLLVGAKVDISLLQGGSVAFIMGNISVITVIGALPMFECMFSFVTPMQLLEMTNPNQPILKRLLLEATGTYYHSLLVANLAEAAATSIGANALLTRVGGYYHDIGKLNCSSYFRENQSHNNPHDYMTPKESYDVIVSHVTIGLRLANEYELPQYIKDFIVQHHGTSTMQYFYVKAKQNSDEPIIEKDFQYPGPKPQSKEIALVMLADVVEATIRAMQSQLGKEVKIEEVVRKSVKQKMDEGQLDECDLCLSDINKIIDSFTKMLTGMYHERIAYPERNEKE